MLLYDDSFAFVKCAVLIIAPYVSESLHTKKNRITDFASKIGSSSRYRLSLYLLSSYLGPRLAKISDLYAGFYALGMRLHLVTYFDLKDYGR